MAPSAFMWKLISVLKREAALQNDDLQKELDGEKVCAWRILYENSYIL